MNKKTQFDKFTKKKGSVIKEEIRRDKKSEREERQAAIKERMLEKKKMRGGGKPEGKKTEGKKAEGRKPEERKTIDKKKQGFKKIEGRAAGRIDPVEKKPLLKKSTRSEAAPRTDKAKPERTPRFDKTVRPEKNLRSEIGTRPERAPRVEKSSSPEKSVRSEKVSGEKKSVSKPASEGSYKAFREKKTEKSASPAPGKASAPGRENNRPEKEEKTANTSGLMPLNKFIAHGGICSRRDAAILVKEGKVTVDGTPATDPGMKVTASAMVKVNGKKVTPSRHFVYILLNKPKDYITTLDDPQGRKTVLDLVRSATDERVYPVGRLDRNTSGVLLLTNDGDLAQTLAHPKFEAKKIYHVGLDKPLTKNDFERIMGGLPLEDGVALVDALAYADPKDKTQIGIEIHSGKNRIVRRIFEHLGYDVRTLDRVTYAGLTKKNVQRGKWRMLTEKEIRILKFFNNAKIAKDPTRKKA